MAPKKARNILATGEIKKILDAMDCLEYSKFYYPYFYTLIHTGARRAEVAKLTWNDINLEAGLITFRNTKNKTNRTIKIGEALKKVLYDIPKNSNHIFTKWNRPISVTMASRYLEKLRAHYPHLPYFTCHDLRHSFAFNFLKKGGNMYSLKAILGHKSIQMTIDLYGNYKSIDVENPSPYDF